jgi:hypothetical protein
MGVNQQSNSCKQRMKTLVRFSPVNIGLKTFIPFAPAFRLFRFCLAGCLLLNAAQMVRAQQNTPPTISAILDQVTDEDVPLIEIPFTVRDAESSPEQLRFSTVFGFSDRNSGSVVIGGSGTNRWVSVFPPRNISGTGSVTVVVSDAGGLSASSTFRLEVRPVNDPPWLSVIPDQVALKGQGLFTVPFSAWDAESGSNLEILAWSSRQGIVSNSALRVVQAAGVSNRVLQVTLGPQGVSGSTAITVQADDRQDKQRASFILNVVEPEFAEAAHGIPGGQNFQPSWGDFNGDGFLDLVVSPTFILTCYGSGSFTSRIQLPEGVSVTGTAPADFDGDGHLDLLEFGGTLRLLRNNGGSPITFSAVPLPGLFSSSRAFWADIDGDGDLDILPSSIGSQSTWLRNDGRNGFVPTSFGFSPNGSATLLAVGDFDNDGDLDLVVALTSTAQPGPRIYENDGTGRFQEAPVSLPQAMTRAAGWVDVDGDGSLDLWLVQGSTQSATNTLVVLRQSAGRFAESFRLSWYPVFTATGAITNLAWADFDNDGYVDFAGPVVVPAQERVAATNYTVIYHNDGAGHFSASRLPAAVQSGQLLPVVGDLDNDGSADLLYRTSQQGLLSLRNQARVLNSLPDAPSSLRAHVDGNRVTLFWNDAQDGNQKAALTYNVRIGSSPGLNDLVPSMSTTNGARLIPAPGNAGFNTWMLLALPSDQIRVETLYWSVQAVDASFQGGPFASEQNFYINPPGNQPPSIVGIGDLTLPENSTTNIVFYVRDDRTPPNNLRVQAASSNPVLIAQTGLRLSGFTATDLGLRVTLSLTPVANHFGETTIFLTATDRGGLSETRSFVVSVTAAGLFTPPAASMALTTVNPGQLEIELHAAPETALRLEASSDLKNWSDYPMAYALAQTGTNGVCRIPVIPSGENQFFRAKQMP